MSIKFLSQKVAQQIDVELMSGGGFSIYQLMELAGLSVAQSISKEYNKEKYSTLLICCGPGNNGGDGLVASRHLKHMGYNPVVYYPKKNEKEIFLGLVTQLNQLEIPIYEEFTKLKEINYSVIIDCIFGFSFKYTGIIKDPFNEVVDLFNNTNLPVAAVDVPSGWPVDEEEYIKTNDEQKKKLYQPEMLISLTAPKQCAKYFKGKHHYLGGRFIPNKMLQQYDLLNLPRFNNSDQCAKFDNKL
ncbi:YjeF N-terminal domain-like protein [Neoconidiobolus thromboides FSU 785]|nr:YjeF N-terminal domain-like protein [Neoconidiobolus thromboides FSU 785]